MHADRPVYGRARLAALLVVGCGLAGGCRTQQDAAAAASQMATTAQTVAAYYASLDHVLAETEDAYEAQYTLLGVPPEDLSETRAEIQKRADLAKQIGNLATTFQKLTGPGSDAAATATEKPAKSGGTAGAIAHDVSATGASKPASSGSSGTSISGALQTVSDNSQVLDKGIDAILALIREHEEVKAARDMAPLCDNLAKFFDQESGIYDSINEAYLVTAKSVAQKMVQENEVDISAVFVSSLQPFGLAPSISRNELRSNLQPFLLAQIDKGYAAKLDSAQAATAALDKALGEMDARVKLVAQDKPMRLRIPPFSLKTVESWIAEVNP